MEEEIKKKLIGYVMILSIIIVLFYLAIIIGVIEIDSDNVLCPVSHLTNLTDCRDTMIWG